VAGEVVAGLQSGANAILSLTAAPKSKSPDKAMDNDTDKFSDVLGDYNTKKDEPIKADEPAPEDDAVLMAAAASYNAPYVAEDVAVEEAVIEVVGEIAAVQTEEVKAPEVFGELRSDNVVGFVNEVTDEAVQTVEMPVTDVETDMQAELQVAEGEAMDMDYAPPAEIAENESAVQFVQFMSTTDVKATEIESVKYRTIGPVDSESNKTAALGRMERLIQRMFFGGPEVEREKDDFIQDVKDKDSENEDVPKTAMGEEIKEVVRIVTEENTDGDGKMVEPTTEFGKLVENVEEVKPLEASEDMDNEFDMGDDGSSGFGEVLDKNQNDAAKTNTNAFGLNNVQTFKIHDIDINRNVAQQVNRIMTSTFNTSGMLDEAEGMKEMELQLNPESLGRIIIKMQSVNGVLDIKISATNAEVREMLMVQSAQLTNAIKEQGVNVNQMEVAQSALHNDKEESNNPYKENKEKEKSKQDDEDEIDFVSIQNEIEAALSALEVMA